MKYITMTVFGEYGNAYEAETDEVAEALANADGYEVIDIMDENPNLIVLVVEA